MDEYGKMDEQDMEEWEETLSNSWRSVPKDVIVEGLNIPNSELVYDPKWMRICTGFNANREYGIEIEYEDDKITKIIVDTDECY